MAAILKWFHAILLIDELDQADAQKNMSVKFRKNLFKSLVATAVNHSQTNMFFRYP